MNVLVVNGPNLNLLGEREPAIYGTMTLAELERKVLQHAQTLGQTVRFFQSNHEGGIIDYLHAQRTWADAIILNPAAYTHYSYAIRDAILAVAKPTAEVHLSDINKRGKTESFRLVSVVRDVCVHHFMGGGLQSYFDALDAFAADEADVELPP